MKVTSRIIASAALLTTLAGCGKNATQNSSMELKVYSVPAAQTADLANALNESLSALKARASVAMQGKVLVYAPGDAQTSIGAAIDDLAKSTPVSPAVQPPLRVSFWMINAQPGSGTDDAALAPMSSMLDALRVAMGPHHFNLMESVSGVSSGSMSSIATGSGHDFRFKTERTDQGVRFFIFYGNESSSMADKAELRSLDVQVIAQLGQYQVLASTMAAASDGTKTSADAPATLRLLVARVETASPEK